MPLNLSMLVSKSLSKLADNDCCYLKDFHLHRASPGWYAPPPGLDDDWLNRFCDREGRDDFRFLYLGGDGSRTPLHADVLASHSWSANISGAKEWWLFPPSETSKLQDAAGARRGPRSRAADPKKGSTARNREGR